MHFHLQRRRRSRRHLGSIRTRDHAMNNNSMLTSGPIGIQSATPLPAGLQGNTSEAAPNLAGILGKVINGTSLVVTAPPATTFESINQILVDASIPDQFAQKLNLTIVRFPDELDTPPIRMYPNPAVLLLEWGIGGANFRQLLPLEVSTLRLSIVAAFVRLTVVNVTWQVVGPVTISWRFSASVGFGGDEQSEIYCGRTDDINPGGTWPFAYDNFPNASFPTFAKTIRIFASNANAFVIQRDGIDYARIGPGERMLPISAPTRTLSQIFNSSGEAAYYHLFATLGI